MKGRLHTRYAPVRRSLCPKTNTPRLACVKPAASVHPEPGSNSSSYIVDLNNLRSFCYSNQSLSVLFQSLDYLTLYSFVLTSLLKRLSIQYVYERVFLLVFRFSFVTQSGCKSRKLISNRQMFFEVFLKKFFIPFSFFSITNLSMSSDVLRGANVTSVFKSHKLF